MLYISGGKVFKRVHYLTVRKDKSKEGIQTDFTLGIVNT